MKKYFIRISMAGGMRVYLRNIVAYFQTEKDARAFAYDQVNAIVATKEFDAASFVCQEYPIAEVHVGKES